MLESSQEDNPCLLFQILLQGLGYTGDERAEKPESNTKELAFLSQWLGQRPKAGERVEPQNRGKGGLETALLSSFLQCLSWPNLAGNQLGRETEQSRGGEPWLRAVSNLHGPLKTLTMF